MSNFDQMPRASNDSLLRCPERDTQVSVVLSMRTKMVGGSAPYHSPRRLNEESDMALIPRPFLCASKERRKLVYRARGNGADYRLMRGASGQNCSSPPTNRRYRTLIG